MKEERVVKKLEQLVTETIFPRIYARMYYAQGCARVMSFSNLNAVVLILCFCLSQFFDVVP